MTEPIDRPTPGSPPDSGNLRVLAQDVLESVRTVRERLRIEATEMEDRREQLEASQLQLTRERDEQKSQQENLFSLAADLNRRQADSDQTRIKIEADTLAVTEHTRLLKSKTDQLEKMKSDQAAVDAELRRREEALHSSEAEIQEVAREIEPRQRKIESLEQELAGRSAKLAKHAEEMMRTRETLAAMQAQLTRDHQEVAAQREELLRRLESLPETAGSHEPMPELFEPAGVATTWHSGPKPATVGGVDQFRKLRRDAKRRAIGV